MNSTPHSTEDASGSSTVSPVSPATLHHHLDPSARRSTIRSWRAEKVTRWLSRSPFFQPFCTLLKPAIHWLLGPTNAVVVVLILILSPLIALIILPLFLILIPAGLGIGIIAMVANSMKIDADEGEEVSFAGPMLR